MVNAAEAVATVLDSKYFEIVLGHNQAEHRNWGNNITGLQTNIIYCHINGLKT